MDEIKSLKIQVENSKMPSGLKEKALKMLDRLSRMADSGNFSTEFDIVEHYIQNILQIPFGSYTKDNLDINHAIDILDRNHFGLNEIKNRIGEYVAVMNLQSGKISQASEDMSNLAGNSSHAPILCFVGVQGIGKTTMAKSLAEALNKKFVRISLNALGNIGRLKGMPRYVTGAEPGQIIKALQRAGTMNPIILLDEMDKTAGNEVERFDYNAALIEILDPEQNGTYMDAYIDYPIDLSNVMFIATANTLGTLSAALLDRLEIIRFSSYNDAEKANIAENYLLPKIRKSTGLNEDQMTFTKDVWPLMIRPLGFDAGIRQLERNLTNVARKVARMIVEQKADHIEISPQNFRQFIPEDIGVYS